MYRKNKQTPFRMAPLIVINATVAPLKIPSSKTNLILDIISVAMYGVMKGLYVKVVCKWMMLYTLLSMTGNSYSCVQANTRQ